MLPVAESEIKEQEWPGKKHDDKTPPSTTTSASSIASGLASSDEQKSVDEEHEIEDKPKEPELSDEQRTFIDKLLAEMDMVASFKNNPGRPIGELKLLDHDALQQLESRLSIDDQYAFLYAFPEHSPHIYSGARPTPGYRDLRSSYA